MKDVEQVVPAIFYTVEDRVFQLDADALPMNELTDWNIEVGLALLAHCTNRLRREMRRRGGGRG